MTVGNRLRPSTYIRGILLGFSSTPLQHGDSTFFLHAGPRMLVYEFEATQYFGRPFDLSYPRPHSI